MAQTDAAARTKNYRVLRTRTWEDLGRQHAAYVEYFQENEGLGLGGLPIDESRFHGPVNLFLDELLTHSSKADAAVLAKALPPGWGTASESVLYHPTDRINAFIDRSLPDQQWGDRPVDPAVAADPVKWQAWLRARLQLLGVPGEHVFAAPGRPPQGTAAVPPAAVTRSVWRVALPVLGGVALTAGAYAWLSHRSAQRRTPQP
jgi:hypothetical protein